MSIGFRPPSPDRQSEEVEVWRATKGQRRAAAFVRIFDHGRDLIVRVDGEWHSTRLFKNHELAGLHPASEDICRAFEARGWRREPLI